VTGLFYGRLNQLTMLKSYFLLAWRNIRRNKVSSIINTAGLSISIAAALLIIIFIRYELSYDRFHKDAGRIFQVTLNGNMNGQEFFGGNTPPPIGQALYSNIPEIESFTRFYKTNDLVVRYANNSNDLRYFTEKNVLGADSNFLTLFSFPVKEGSPATALLKPGSVVLTEAMAIKYFGAENALGKTLLLGGERKPFVVTAVLKNVPAASSVQFDFLIPMADNPVVKRMGWSWVWRLMVTYVKLRSNIDAGAASVKQIESKFPAVVRVQAASGFSRIGKPFDEFIKKGGKWDFHLLPLTRIHLYANAYNMPWLANVSDSKYIWIFSCVALFILILACVNFMNLSTAQASKRAKEIGIRKVMGSVRRQLIFQFLAESFVYVIISAVAAFGIVLLLIKPFSIIASIPVGAEQIINYFILGVSLLLIVTVGLLAGIYPAFYMTKFAPVSVLKGNDITKSGKGNTMFRNGLVVFQFAVSTIIIICTLVVYHQLQYFQKTDLGFTKENVVVISSTNRLGKSEESFRQTISQLPGVRAASVTSSIPTGSLFGDSYVPEPGGNDLPQTKELDLNSFLVDDQFVPALQIRLTQGRNFSREFADSSSVIINEQAARQIGWKHPIGKWLTYPGGDGTRFQVIGIMHDFNVVSLQFPIEAFALFYTSSKTYDLGVTDIIVRLDGDPRKPLEAMNNTWKTFVSGEPFDYNFLDASFDRQYRSEQRLGTLFTLFAGLSVFIACLGLFGLSVYIAERRTKEIGIRKVLGASEKRLVALLSKDFLQLMLLAVVMAFPLAWWAMDNWLQSFAYRIKMSWTDFILAATATLCVALFTVSFQAIRAAMANPVKSLRAE